MDAGYAVPEVPKILVGDARFKYIKNNFHVFNYSPGVDRLKKEIVDNFGLQRVDETAVQMPTFFVNLDSDELAGILKSNLIAAVSKIDLGDETYTFSAFSDLVVGGKLIPWGKQEIGADDSITSSRNFYIVDARYTSSVLSSKNNISYTNGSGHLAVNHSAAVISLAVAKSNNSKIREINPGQPVVHLGTYLDSVDILNNIALISSMAEWNNGFSTLNSSINHGNGVIPTNFQHTGILGNAMRRASGRLFIAQSAGNFNRDACKTGFNYDTINKSFDPYDGIMVVGGINSNGYRYPLTINPYSFYTEDASNFGSCIEIWVPGSLMTTTISDGSIVTATGTSFAAPLVASIASRYGGKYTRPIEREAYIRDGKTFTYRYENASTSNLPIYRVAYTSPSLHSIPEKLPVYYVYSDANQENINKLVDEKFYDGIDWNAYSNWGSIVLDLESPKNVKGIRVMIRSSAVNGALNFAVHGGNSINISAPGKATMPSNPIAYKNTTDQFDLVPYYINLNGNYRYIMLQASNTSSSLSYSEVEVYGF